VSESRTDIQTVSYGGGGGGDRSITRGFAVERGDRESQRAKGGYGHKDETEKRNSLSL